MPPQDADTSAAPREEAERNRLRVFLVLPLPPVRGHHRCAFLSHSLYQGDIKHLQGRVLGVSVLRYLQLPLMVQLMSQRLTETCVRSDSEAD